MAGAAGADASKLPPVRGGNDPIGEVDGAALAGGTIDAFGEQLVAGADDEGDALVILGATLITWAVIPDWREEPGLWTIPHTALGKILIGGPSNSGGLFLDWALRLAGRPRGGAIARPGEVPVFLPYVRGERTPLHDPHRRASVHGLALTHGPEALRRAAHEAGGFVVRHHFERGKVSPRRIVATGGGTRSAEWVQAIADCTGIPVDVVAVPEGGALGSAFLARVSAGLEPSSDGSARWARYSRTVEPDPAWVGPCEERYARFLELTGPVGNG
jgi:xylulokinase